MRIELSIAFVAFWFLNGCAPAPTKTFTAEDIDVLFLQKNLARPISITSQTVIIDARSAFEYAVVHSPNSINLQWRDFCDPEKTPLGVLRNDQTDGARRLALAGVTPGSAVVVVGGGLDGHGEEGRLAWTLLYLGVQDVQTAQLDSLHLRYSNIETRPRENKPIWVPKIRSQIAVDYDDFKAAIDNGAAVIIDVRSPEEIGSSQPMIIKKLPKYHPVNLSWNQFFAADGRPNFAVRKKLADLKIKSQDRIVLISNRGVRSGAATFALLSLGYKKAANFAGGYEELFARLK